MSSVLLSILNFFVLYVLNCHTIYFWSLKFSFFYVHQFSYLNLDEGFSWWWKMESVTRVQILDEAVCVLLHSTACGKCMNHFVLLPHPIMSKKVGHNRFFSSWESAKLKEGIFWMETSPTPVKNWRSVTSCFWESGKGWHLDFYLLPFSKKILKSWWKRK